MVTDENREGMMVSG